MKLAYYASTDSLYIDLSEQTGVSSREISEGVVLDYDSAGQLVGIDIQRQSQGPTAATRSHRYGWKDRATCELATRVLPAISLKCETGVGMQFLQSMPTSRFGNCTPTPVSLQCN